MKRLHSIRYGFLGLLALATLVAAIAWLRVASQPSAIAGPPVPTLPPLTTPVAHRPSLPAIGEVTARAPGVARGILFAGTGKGHLLHLDEKGQGAGPASELVAGLEVSDLYPAPDGQHVVAIRNVETGQVATIVDTKTGESWPLGPQAGVGKFFNWFPDSRRILWYTEEPGPLGLRAIDVFNGEVQPLSDPNKPETVWSVQGAAVSPDGEQVVFVTYGTAYGPGQMWTVRADGSNLQSLFSIGEMPTFGLAWSPDGKLIAYIGADGAGKDGLCVMSPDGQNRRVISQYFSQGRGFLPVWSPDSRTIAFVARELPEEKTDASDCEQWLMKGNNVHLIDLESGQEGRLLPDSQEGNIDPAWSPDGSQIAFVSNRNGKPDIWVAGVDGTGLQQMTGDGNCKRWPVWLQGGAE